MQSRFCFSHVQILAVSVSIPWTLEQCTPPGQKGAKKENLGIPLLRDSPSPLILFQSPTLPLRLSRDSLLILNIPKIEQSAKTLCDAEAYCRPSQSESQNKIKPEVMSGNNRIKVNAFCVCYIFSSRTACFAFVVVAITSPVSSLPLQLFSYFRLGPRRA